MLKNLFQGKIVTVIGLGLHGGGVAVVLWLIKHGAKVTVTDLKTKKELQTSIDKIESRRRRDSRISPSAAVKYVLGKHREIDFKNTDLIIQNPGVPKESQYLKIAKKAGVPIENDASLFFKYCLAPIIGVTGTRGKSTTSTLIYELLRRCDSRIAPAGKVWLAGLPQKPMLEILDQIKPSDIVVLELSSWQLEILGQKKLSPQVAVITNIYPDHLNRYSSMKKYIVAKKNIFLWQNQDDLAVVNLDNPETKKIGEQIVCQRFWFSKKYFPEENGCLVRNGGIFLRQEGKESKVANIKDIKLIGEHNLENVLAAITVAGIFGVPAKTIKSTLIKFKVLPGRLELIREIKDVKYINDTTATTPDATIMALRAISSKLKAQSSKQIILIAGGDSKNIPDAKYKKLTKIIKKSCKAVVLFSGRGSDQIAKQLKSVKFKPVVVRISDITEAVGLANSFSRNGDTILLSPASASFGLFVNEFDRGEQFKKVVSRIKN